MWPEADNFTFTLCAYNIALLLLVNLRMLSRLLASGVALRVASLSLCGWLSYFFVGLLKTEPVAEEGEDAVTMLSAPEALTEEEQEELRRELTKVEEEIQTLSQVLAAKEKHLAELKRKLGISSLQEFKQNIAKGWQDVTATNAYKKTSETLSQAGQKASAAFSSVGSVITKKLEDVKLQAFSHSFRNSPTFKSFEEKVENLKSKVGGAKPAGGDFGEVLNSTANATSTMTTEPPPEQMTESP
ncbi:tumor protein D52 isoform X2 [Mus musculus]|uniref:tumor protein D52 isoform X2 n=1 Tax=Mus musculus TaxID=10090 RepID=UPI0005AB9915|nr:tumor protein D52 isoform X2 [Mus musculus]|eukprot:XP_011246445.1 PREDICTED: tumor protein D52 isoform X2 [Mus musculus]